MPLYEYQCQDCGVRFERRQHINDEPVKICPECGGEVHRLIQPVGIIFKGSGFYVTDNRAKSSTAKPGSAKKPSKVAEESTSTGADESSTESNAKSSADE
ncbi:MAG: FmdB family zinc ribbon protein [Chloroflexota bacterium]|nr:FmdB family zinc ribbon protein [Chloroflexota bacterium]